MKLNVKFEQTEQTFKATFGETYRESDGGYERGYEEGYNAGYSVGYTEGETMGEAQGYMRGYDVGFQKGEDSGYTKGYNDGYAAGYKEGFAKGKEEGYSKGKEDGYTEGYNEGVASVDNNLVYAQTARFGNLNLFGKADVVIDMPYLQSAGMMFRLDTTIWGSSACLNRTVEHITINSKSENITQTYQMFYFAEPWDGQTALKHITLNMDMSRVTSVQYMFNGCSLLETIDGTPLDFSSVVDSTVTLANAAPKLAYIRFAPNTIKVNLNVSGNGALTNESIQSIIDGLADLTGQASKSIMWHSSIADKLTADQINTILAKNWTM